MAFNGLIAIEIMLPMDGSDVEVGCYYPILINVIICYFGQIYPTAKSKDLRMAYGNAKYLNQQYIFICWFKKIN